MPARRRFRLTSIALALAAVAAPALLAACATGSGVSVRFPERVPGRWPERLPRPEEGGGGAAAPVAARALDAAEDYLGVPYRWGGTSPRTGFDCSGYVQYVFRREGVSLPRTSRQQAAAGRGRPTRWDAAAPGDLVMFAEPGAAISHVAFYAGRGRILHSSGSGGGVRFDDLGTRRGRWYRERLVAVRRVTDRGPAVARSALRALGLDEAPLDPPDRAPAPR